MKRVIFIIGEPGVGKTTIMKRYMKFFKWKKDESFPLVPCMRRSDGKVCILGTYGEEIWGGTDRLSLAVQPKAMEFIKKAECDIVLEGDRLNTPSFLHWLVEQPEIRLTIMVITARELTVKARHKQRGDHQSEVFIKGRRTKIARVCKDKKLAGLVKLFRNENHFDLEWAATFLLDCLPTE